MDPRPMNQESPASATQPRPLRWGILGAARIARKALVGAIRDSGGSVEAIGARALDRAREFAGELAIPQAFVGYQAVVDCPEVDAVYIPLANGLHFHWALACARAGKHCLCEKPMVLTTEEARQLRDAFALAGVRLMEAFMWRHHSKAEWIRQQIEAGELGELRRIHASFSFVLDRPDDFRWISEQGGGALWDIGCYCVNAMRYYFGEEPQAVSARAVPVRHGELADRSSTGWLDFGNDRLGVFDCSFTSAYDQSLTLIGTEGVLRVERPFTGPQATFAQLRLGEQVTKTPLPGENSYARMVTHFTRAARDPSFALEPAEDGLNQAITMEALATSTAQGGQPAGLMT